MDSPAHERLRGQRVMVLAAHYDDEALFFGGLLLAAQAVAKSLTIAVLTDVSACNPPRTPQEVAREPYRRNMRLGAFARVCQEVGATGIHLRLPQIAECKDRHATTALAEWVLLDALADYEPSVVVTHGVDGDYTAQQYASGFDVARAQHRWAADLASSCQPTYGYALWHYDRQGSIAVPVDLIAKSQLLDYYRYGCTQTPEWHGRELYPEFSLAQQECYTCR
jgi:LmbE family N-acetylglucosaminyl deacetylase